MTTKRRSTALQAASAPEPTSRTRRTDRTDGRRHRTGEHRELVPTGSTAVFDRIVGAATELLERDGVTKLTVGEIAGAAGVSRTSFYAHFTGRDAVLHAVLLRRAVGVVEGATAVAAACESFDDLCIAIFEHGFRTIRSDPVLARMLADEGSAIGAGLATASDAFLELILEFWQPFVEQAQAAHEVRPELEPAEVTRWLLRVLLSFLGTREISEAQVRRTLEVFVLPALRTAPGRGGASPSTLDAFEELEARVTELSKSLEAAKRALAAGDADRS